MSGSLTFCLKAKDKMLRSGREDIGMEVDSHRWVAVPSLMSASGVLLLCRSSHYLTLSYIRGLPIVRRLFYSVDRAI